MNNKIIAQYADVPLEKSIGPVSRELSLRPLFVAIKASTPDFVEFSVAADKQGHLWIYIFTDQEEFSKAFPSGGAFAEMKFTDILATVGPDNRFGGIFVNSKSTAMYVIPREAFAYAYKLITNPANQ